ncbi:hypothetical protein HG530_000210 [Fusarium avenaceum]|nr:hypothetical protein HG530_000210 [Fusarium avenaceum]
MISLTEAKSCDTAKDHLRPCQHRHQLANDGMAWSNQLSDLSINTLLPVALEVKSKNNLRYEEELEDMREFAMDVIRNKLATLMRMAQEETENGETCSNGLGRNMPSVLCHLEYVNNALETHAKELLTPRTMPIGKITP